MADNEKAQHEIAANTTCEFVNKEVLQELDKIRNASKLEDEDRVVHNLKSYLPKSSALKIIDLDLEPQIYSPWR